MKLSGLHILTTYQCTNECDHCFVWSSPRSDETMPIERVRSLLEQARELGTVEWIFFEGGEPFLFYATLLRGAEAAAGMGFRVGLVSNAYWAVSAEDARVCLGLFGENVQDLSISGDRYHAEETITPRVANALEAADRLGISAGVISIAQPGERDSLPSVGQVPVGTSAVMFRGRAAQELTGDVEGEAWDSFTACPHEDLREPGRLHVDPLGHLHICQGISLGNAFESSLRAVCEGYEPEKHPITGPLLEGGPAELVRRYGLPHADRYADACHLCYEARRALRERFPEILAPDQVYGVTGG
jgi:hypothetical protein